MGKLKSYQQQLQDIVEKGINAAEVQQKKLAAKPFELAEKLESGVREYSVNGLRTRYNGYSESMFDQLRNLNGRFGNFAGDLVARLEKEVSEGADAVTETALDAAVVVSEMAEDVKQEAVDAAVVVSETAENVKQAVSEKESAAKKAADKKAAASKKESTPA